MNINLEGQDMCVYKEVKYMYHTENAKHFDRFKFNSWTFSWTLWTLTIRIYTRLKICICSKYVQLNNITCSHCLNIKVKIYFIFATDTVI